MKKLLLPLFLGLIGVAGGVGAGIALRPPEPPAALANPCGDIDTANGDHAGESTPDGHETEAEQEYVKLNNQFIVPVVSDDSVASLVVMSLSVEIGPSQRDQVYAKEPKLRDAFLQTLFDHANMGGFEGTFTDGNTLDILRAALTETARNILGRSVTSVLIVDIARQDI